MLDRTHYLNKFYILQKNSHREIWRRRVYGETTLPPAVRKRVSSLPAHRMAVTATVVETSPPSAPQKEAICMSNTYMYFVIIIPPISYEDVYLSTDL